MKTIEVRIWPSLRRYPKSGWEHSYTLPNGRGGGGGGHRNVTLDEAKYFIAASLTDLGYSDYKINFVLGDMVFTPRSEQNNP